MKLHENKELFQDAVIATSQQMGIPEIYVEKDYWVTFALFHIFKNDIGKETVFKGGTGTIAGTFPKQPKTHRMPAYLAMRIKIPLELSKNTTRQRSLRLLIPRTRWRGCSLSL